MAITPYLTLTPSGVKALDDTKRGDQGFGSIDVAAAAAVDRQWGRGAATEGSSEKKIKDAVDRWDKVAVYAASMGETSADRVTNANFLRSMLGSTQ